MSADSSSSRRDFLLGSAALFLGRDGLHALVSSAGAPAQPSVLTSSAQYASESREFESAMRELASATQVAVDSDSARKRFTDLVAAACARLDRQHSWVVAQCLADPNLERWVRSTVRDERSFNTMISSLQQDPGALNAVPALSALRARLTALKSEKARIVEAILTKERAIAGIEAAASSAATRAGDAQQCEQTWAIVTAMLTVVVEATPVPPSVVSAGATLLATTYKGTGADRARSAAQAAEREYRRCATAASALPPGQRAPTIASCQLRWLETTGPR